MLRLRDAQPKDILMIQTRMGYDMYSYGHLPVITGYFYGIIHSINGVISTYNW